jgi:polysaccharide biosynthesis transport protein
MHLWDYWGVVMKRFYLVVLFVGASVGTAFLITQNQEPNFRATATIEILPPSISGAEAAFMPMIFTDDRFLDTQVEKLRMQSTIERAVRAQKLSQQAEFKGRSDGEIARLAHGKVEVGLRRNKLLLDVSVTGSDAKVLPHLANALVLEFQDMQRSESRVRREAARQDIEARIGKLQTQEKLARTDKKLQLEQKHCNEQTFEYVYLLERKRLEQFTERCDVVKRYLSQHRVVNDAYKTASTKGDEAIAALGQSPEIRQHPDVRDMQAAIDALRDEQEQLRKAGTGTNNPEYRRLGQEEEKKRASLQRTVRNIVDAFLLEYRAREEELVDLTSELGAIDAKVQEVVTLKALVDDKNAEIEHAKDEIALLNKRLEPIVASAWEDRDSVRISQQATEPTEPFSPNRSANLTLGAVVGVLGGIALAFVLDYLDDTIRTKDELAKVADVPLLGIVPNIEGRSADPSKKDLFAQNQPKSTISEAYRGVRTALTLSAQGPMQKVLLLTSAGPREGKTTTAINLATVLAYSGARTLLIDADLRKPRIHKSFGLPNSRGLTNLIIGQDDPLEACLPSQVERIDVLPSGPIPPNPSELLGHPRMREILRRLRERYDHIIVDTPPIGAVTDAAVLATVVDGVILVVHAGKTRRQIVMRGLEQLRYINARIVGVILNNLRVSRVRYYPGYYHYYYYYASHYGAEETPAKTGPDRPVPPAGGKSA